jgi:hypothetical protein
MAHHLPGIIVEIVSKYWWRWGYEGKNKGAKVGRKNIQQSTRAGGGVGKQWEGVVLMGGNDDG